MAARLEALAANTDLRTNEYANTDRLRFLEGRPAPTEPAAKDSHDKLLAVEAILAGKPNRAIERLMAMRRALEADPHPDPRNQAFVQQYLVLAYLRKGEQDNCLEDHSPDSCLFPIEGGGVHRNQQGSRMAMAELAERLKVEPGDLTARWLYNIAAMTVGDYPNKVPKAWRVPRSALGSAQSFTRFRDVAANVGLDTVSLAGGAVVEDFDRDGLFDVMVSSMGHRDQLRLFMNTGKGKWQERTVEAGLQGLVAGLNLTHGDYDNDGDADVLVLRGAWLQANGHKPNSLLRNDGGGKFTDVTEAAGLTSASPSQTAVWGDFDNDGWLDLFVGNEAGHGHRHPCELYRNGTDGTFKEVGAAAGVATSGYIKAVTAGDYDNDGWLDLYVSRMDGPNVLFRNSSGDGKGLRFIDATKRAGVAEPTRSFPTWFFDYDNDGWLDLWVSGYRANISDVLADYMGLPNGGVPPKLYANRGDGTFEDVAKKVGIDTPLLTMGCNFGDLDNDGWLDFYAGTGEPNLQTLVPNRMFRNVGGQRFADVTTAGGFGHLQKGHGVAFVDLDHDGDQDVFAVIGGAYSGDVFQNALYENPGHGNHFIKIELQGVRSNRAGIGARLKLGLAGGRTIHRVLSTGGSFGSAPLRLEIGLGAATQVDTLEIVWPASGITSRYAKLEADRWYHIVEGAEAPTVIRDKPHPFATK